MMQFCLGTILKRTWIHFDGGGEFSEEGFVPFIFGGNL